MYHIILYLVLFLVFSGCTSEDASDYFEDNSLPETLISDIEEFVQKTPEIQIVYQSNLPVVDGKITDNDERQHWIPVFDSDWRKNEHFAVTCFNTARNG